MVKVGYFAVLCAALWLWADFEQERVSSVHAALLQRFGIVPSAATAGLFTRHFATWDAEHYLLLSDIGYGKETPSRAFYPLWPLAIRWFSVMTGGNGLVAGLILANILSVAAWTLFYDTAARRFGQRAAVWALALLIAFPGSLFYQFLYSESLFLLLLMLVWTGLERGWYNLTFAASFFLPLVRGVGLFTVLPLAWFCAPRVRWHRTERYGWFGQQLSLSTRSGGGKREVSFWAALGLVCAPALGFGLYLALMRGWTGNPLAGIEAQSYWGVHSLSNLWNVPKFVSGYFSPTCWHEFSGSVLDRCGFMLLVCLLPLIWRLGKDLVLWTFALGVLPAMSGTFTSFIRFESLAFPLFIGFGVLLIGLGRRWLGWALVGGLAILHLVLLWRFVNFRWAG